MKKRPAPPPDHFSAPRAPALALAGLLLSALLLWASCGGRAVTLRADGGRAASDGLAPDLYAGPDRGKLGALDLPNKPRKDLTTPDQGTSIPGTWINLKPGSFLMGSPASELCRLSNEQQHSVKLTHAFQITATEVTQSQYQQVMEHNPSAFKSCGGACPVDSVTWSDAAMYANHLSKRAGLDTCYLCDSENGLATYPYNCRVNPLYLEGGKTLYSCPGYRLPTEAEWEYAYRAGTTTSLHNSSLASCYLDPAADAIAWYHKNAGKMTHAVGKKLKNNWGLYDMAGNAWEWVNDCYQYDLGGKPAVDPAGPVLGVGKVLKGGSWSVTAGGLRAAARQDTPPALGQAFLSFRPARTLK